ncbi:MAG: hypothetical protein Q4B59_04710 [Lachnospiraceae bacterium]|nr:hypothetical protein [Lachnospiraceae bacterium]
MKMKQDEKVYKTLGTVGALGIGTGVVVIVASLAAGIVMIVSGAKLLARRSDMLIR